MTDMLPHGGDLDAARRRQAAVRDWIDLSTGLNPWPYQVDAIAPELWARLPGRDLLASLKDAAAHRYDAPAPQHVVAAPGTQALLQLLPRLRSTGRVAIVGFTYAEHARCWRLAGHAVEDVDRIEDAAAWADTVVLVNPNNPDGRLTDPAEIRRAAGLLSARGGWLVVDEAFADVVPACSVAAQCSLPGLIVLRSFGKFFGLGGLRLGFALAAPDLAAGLTAALGPWAVSGPAAEIGRRALSDEGWIGETRRRLDAAAGALRETLATAGLRVLGGTSLYVLAETPHAAALSDHLERHGLLVRSFPEYRPTWLRFGLPADGRALERLAQALATAPRQGGR